MASQVNITLTALNADVLPPKRVLNLNPERLAIQIGRASKSLSKGLLGASDNAWFDSPVMSRDHAEISFNLEDSAIAIRDIGSMHGTYLNSVEVLRNEPKTITDGDVVVFGAEVRRGVETFPACAFRVNCEYLSWNTNKPNTFTFPDPSDIEDEDLDFSDEDMGDNEDLSSEDDVSVESQPFKASEAVTAIDLTKDDSPFPLTDSNENLSPVTPSGMKSVDVVFIEVDEEESQFAADSDDLSEDGNDVEEPEISKIVITLEDDAEIEDDEGVEDGAEVEDDCAPGLPVTEAKQGPRILTFASSTVFTSANHDWPDIADNEDTQSDFGLSDAGAEVLRTLFEDPVLYNGGESPEGETNMEKEIDMDATTARDLDIDMTAVNNISKLPEQVTSASSLCDVGPEISSSLSCNHKIEDSAHPSIPGQAMQLDIAPMHQFSLCRQPSPSDAAMVKSVSPMTGASDEVARPVKIYKYDVPSHGWSQPTVKSLGDKTGKHAFFEAREGNKATIHTGCSDHSERNRSATGAIDILTPPDLYATPNGGKDVAALPALLKDLKEEQRRAQPDSAPPFLHDHKQVPTINLGPSTEFDMTSAVKYNESKAAMVAALKSLSPSVRSGLSIQDIIEGGSASESTKKLKRKADDISDVIEKEVRIWASSSPAVDVASIGSAEQLALELQPGTPREDSEATRSDASAAPEHQPSKRLKRFVEAVGYAALGGAAVGAGLFSILVATAPDFL